ncbi:MAG: hypothetical protein E7633_07110 [Ruminococcaceae bacterium]|nr:hypothetical protein [Oscillospiraceae bacterium]
MIVNIDEIYKRLADEEDWDPIEFENHRGEKLIFEQVATIELEGKNYACLYEIDANGEQTTDFPAVVLFEDRGGEYFIDFVTDKKIIEAVEYEVYLMRRGVDENGNPLDGETDEFYDEDESPEDEEADV